MSKDELLARLAKLPPGERIDAIRALRGERYGLSTAAIISLVSRNDEIDAAPDFTPWSGSGGYSGPPSRVEQGAVRSVGADELEPLLASLADPDQSRGRYAAELLSAVPFDSLAELDDEQLRQALARTEAAITTQSSQAVGHLLDAAQRMRHALVSGPTDLIAGLLDGDDDVRRALFAEALVRFVDRVEVTNALALVVLSEESGERTRKAAVASLCHERAVVSPETLAALHGEIRQPHLGAERAGLSRVFGNQSYTAAAAVLVKCVSEETGAEAALSLLSPAGMDELVELYVEIPNAETRDRVLQCVPARTRADFVERVLPFLEELLVDDWGSVETAAMGISKLGADAASAGGWLTYALERLEKEPATGVDWQGVPQAASRAGCAARAVCQALSDILPKAESVPLITRLRDIPHYERDADSALDSIERFPEYHPKRRVARPVAAPERLPPQDPTMKLVTSWTSPREHDEPVFGVAGIDQRAVSAGRGSVVAWNQLQPTPLEATGAFAVVAVGNELFVGDKDGVITTYGPDGATQSWQAHPRWITVLARWDDALLSVGADRIARRWRLSDGECDWECDVARGPNDRLVTGLVGVGPDRVAVSYSFLSGIWVYGGDGRLCEWNAHQDTVWQLRENDRYLFSSSEDGVVACWDPGDWKQRWKAAEHRDAVVALAARGELVVASGMDRTTVVLDADSGNVLARTQTERPVRSLAFVSDRSLLAGTESGLVLRWQLD